MSEGSTTPDLVELVRQLIDAANEGDFDALLSLYSPDAVWDSGSDDIPGERFEGRAAIRGLFEDWFGTLEDVEIEAVEIRNVGSGVVFSHVVQRGRPRGSVAPIEFRFAGVTTWADGLISESLIYTNIGEAPRSRRTARRGTGRMKVKGSRRSFSFLRESLLVRATTS